MKERAGDILIAMLIAAAVLVAFAWWTGEPGVVVADRVRESAEPDLLQQYLSATRTPHRFESGFIVLPATRQSQQRLVQLLATLRRVQHAGPATIGAVTFGPDGTGSFAPPNPATGSSALSRDEIDAQVAVVVAALRALGTPVAVEAVRAMNRRDASPSRRDEELIELTEIPAEHVGSKEQAGRR